MKLLVNCIVSLALMGCAQGSIGPLDSSNESDISEEPGTPPIQSVIVPASTPKTPKPPIDPLITLQNQGVMYSVDATFWEVYNTYIHYGTQSIQQKIQCSNGGEMVLIGSVTDDIYADKLNLDFELTFDHCFVPDGWVTIALTYSGTVKITGQLDGGPFENNLQLTSDALVMIGEMKLNNGQILLVNEQCQINILDNYHETEGIGGLSGKVCGEKVEVSEYDPNQ